MLVFVVRHDLDSILSNSKRSSVWPDSTAEENGRHYIVLCIIM